MQNLNNSIDELKNNNNITYKNSNNKYIPVQLKNSCCSEIRGYTNLERHLSLLDEKNNYFEKSIKFDIVKSGDTFYDEYKLLKHLREGDTNIEFVKLNGIEEKRIKFEIFNFIHENLRSKEDLHKIQLLTLMSAKKIIDISRLDEIYFDGYVDIFLKNKFEYKKCIKQYLNKIKNIMMIGVNKISNGFDKYYYQLLFLIIFIQSCLTLFLIYNKN